MDQNQKEMLLNIIEDTISDNVFKEEVLRFIDSYNGDYKNLEKFMLALSGYMYRVQEHEIKSAAFEEIKRVSKKTRETVDELVQTALSYKDNGEEMTPSAPEE